MTGVRYHKVYARIWTSRGFRQWSDDARLAAFYVLTCPHRNTEGLFRLPLPLAQHELSWSHLRTTEALAALEDDGFIEADLDVDLVWLVNALRWDQPKGPKQVAGAVNALSEIPSSPLCGRYLESAREVCPDLAEAIASKLGWTTNSIEGVSHTLSKGYRNSIEGVSDVPDVSPGQEPVDRVSKGYPPHTHSQAPSQAPSRAPSPSPPSSSTVYPRPVDNQASDDGGEGEPKPETTTHPADRILAPLGIVGATSTKGERNTVERAIEQGWTTDQLAELAHLAATKEEPRAYLLAMLTKRANTAPAAEPSGAPTSPPNSNGTAHTWRAEWNILRAAVSRYGLSEALANRDELFEPRTAEAFRDIRHTLREGTETDAMFAFKNTYEPT